VFAFLGNSSGTNQLAEASLIDVNSTTNAMTKVAALNVTLQSNAEGCVRCALLYKDSNFAAIALINGNNTSSELRVFKIDLTTPAITISNSVLVTQTPAQPGKSSTPIPINGVYTSEHAANIVVFTFADSGIYYETFAYNVTTNAISSNANNTKLTTHASAGAR
jgi:hypothetical protein